MPFSHVSLLLSLCTPLTSAPDPSTWTEAERAAVETADAWKARIPRPERDISEKEWDLYAREVPEWYQDAKFGIYAHWGPYNLGMESANFTGVNNSWYPK